MDKHKSHLNKYKYYYYFLLKHPRIQHCKNRNKFHHMFLKALFLQYTNLNTHLVEDIHSNQNILWLQYYRYFHIHLNIANHKNRSVQLLPYHKCLLFHSKRNPLRKLHIHIYHFRTGRLVLCYHLPHYHRNHYRKISQQWNNHY